MNETGPRPSSKENGPEQRWELCTALAKELIESQETFTFPGIDPAAYAERKAADEEYPGYSTPTDKILAKMAEGFKIVLSASDPESGNIFVMPINSNDQWDSLWVQQLLITDGMDERLKKLIQLARGDL